ncbi:MAG: hypothetical protein WCP60_00095 [bacterium]
MKKTPLCAAVTKKILFSWLLILILFATHGASATGVPVGTPTAIATLSRRSAKPGERVEMVVTVRSAAHPIVCIPSDLSGLHFQILGKPRLLQVDGESVWLFRYRVTPVRNGDYEIPPLRVSEGNALMETKPLFLHVTASGERPPLSAKELSAGVNIPESLGEEVLKAAPQPTPKPTPSPTPHDTRDIGSKIGSSCWKGLKAFWNYSGK